MRYHWSYLRGTAIASLRRTNRWAKKPQVAEVRELILRLPEPIVSKARIDLGDGSAPDRYEFDSRYNAVFDELKVLCELTWAWNRSVPGKWKVRYVGEDCYSLTLEAFRDKARDSWLQDFLRWADRCTEKGFALYLDY
jgi:hypothetical protein